MGFRKADDFYIALGGAKISAKVVVNKIMQRLKQGETAESEPTAADDLLKTRRRRSRATTTSSRFGISVEGIDEVMLRLAKCCRPVPGDPIVGYISLGRGITIHREDCPNVAVLKKDPERFTPVSWDGDPETSFRVEIEVDGWDRHRLLEDMSRTFAEAGINILEARCIVNHPMVKNRFVVEVGDTRSLDQAINRLRNIDAVFDAYRVTPAAASGARSRRAVGVIHRRSGWCAVGGPCRRLGGRRAAGLRRSVARRRAQARADRRGRGREPVPDALLRGSAGRPDRARAPPHDHGVMIVAGRARVTLGEEAHEVGEGDVVYVAGDELHCFEALGDDAARVRVRGRSAPSATAS